MADTHRVMVRLSPELHAQLTAHGSSGQPLAAIVRQALSEYLAKQSEQPGAATEQPQQPPYDPRKFVLGKLCPRNHEYSNTGMSLLRLPSRNCPACTNTDKREKRAARRQTAQL